CVFQQHGWWHPGSGTPGKSDPGAGIPVLPRFFLEEQEPPALALRIPRQHRREMAVVAQDHRLAGKFWRDGLVFARLEVERMVAVADEQVDGFLQGGKRRQRVAVCDAT